jgi:hypothetical protein
LRYDIGGNTTYGIQEKSMLSQSEYKNEINQEKLAK